MKANEAPEKIFISFETDEDGYIYPDYMWHRQQFEGKENIQYVRTDAFIEKAIQFIKDNIEDDRYKSPDEESYRMGCGVDYFETNMFIEDFKKYMEE